MTVGYKIASGSDLDFVFKARTSSPAAATGFKDSGGTDFNNRYEPRGASTARAATGFKIAGGTDLAQVFMDIGAITSDRTLVAGSSGTTDFGYYASEYSSPPPYGSITNRSLGPNNIGRIQFNTGAGMFVGLISPNGVSPADADTVWQKVDITGVFSDSSGGTVTRTLTRSARASSTTSTVSGLGERTWVINTTLARFIAGNSYGVLFTIG